MIALAPPHQSQLRNYTTWLEKHRFSYYILNSEDNIGDKFSMLLLCGGPDVGNNSVQQRESNEIKWFQQSYGKIPVIGICRGLQLANVLLGGNLHQDLPIQPIKHNPNELKESSYHDIRFNDKNIRVNSRHHQGVNVAANGLNILARGEDGMIEMMSGNNSLFVQWHPERQEIWGSEAETIVSDWIREREKDEIDFQKIALINLGRYYSMKGFSVVSEDRIRKSINENYDTNFLSTLIHRYPNVMKWVKDKKGKRAIKIGNWKELV